MYHNRSFSCDVIETYYNLKPKLHQSFYPHLVKDVLNFISVYNFSAQ